MLMEYLKLSKKFMPKKIFNLVCSSVLLLSGAAVFAKDKKKEAIQELKASESLSVLQAKILKTKIDEVLDSFIAQHLGNGYHRTTVYDLYPLQFSEKEAKTMDPEYQQELMGYYDYARDQVAKLSQGKLIKHLEIDFDQDRKKEYAVIVSTEQKSKKENYLFIANEKEALYLQPFAADYLEPVNNGNYPTTLMIGDSKQKIWSPAIKSVALDGSSYVLYFDKKHENWVKISLGS